MGKKVLIIDPNKERRDLYQQVRGQLTPDLELQTAEDMVLGLEAAAAAPFNTIMLGVITNRDREESEARRRQLLRACPTAECLIYNPNCLASYDDLAAFFRLFSLSMKNLQRMYPYMEGTRKCG